MFRKMVRVAASALILSNVVFTLRLDDGRFKPAMWLPPVATAFGLFALAVRPKKLRILADGLAKSLRQRRRLSRQPAPTAKTAKSSNPRVLFVTSNGAGLGHISRVSAIVAKIENLEAITLTLSSAYRSLNDINSNIHYFPSQNTLGLDNDTWGKLFSRQLSLYLEIVEPAVVVFDGTFIYEPLVENCQRYRVPIFWLRRGCWREEVARSSVQLMNPQLYCDGVLVPGDYGDVQVEESHSNFEVLKFPSVVMTAPEDMIEARTAQRELGLELGPKYVLIQLGGGVINDASALRRAAIDAVLAEGYSPVLVANPLDQHPKEVQGAQVVRAFPVAQYFSAFEFAVLAAGYNSVQESISLSLPAVFVPNQFTKTDDQVRRAETVAALGMGLCAMDEAEIRHAVSALANSVVRENIVDKTHAAPPATGAESIAGWLDTKFGSDT